MRAVLDPGVLISAVVSPGGTCAEIIALLEVGRFELVMSPRLVAELRNTLQRERFRRWASEEGVDEFVAAVVLEAREFSDPDKVEPTTRDPKDDYLIALAQAANADVLVSGDLDLLDLEDPPVEVLTPRSFLDRLEA